MTRDEHNANMRRGVKVESHRYTGTTVDAAILHAVAGQTARPVR